MRLPLLTMLALIAGASSALAQGRTDPRGVAFATLGLARTVDDEGLLGTGAGLSAGAGLRVTPVLTVQLVVDRIPYDRETEYLVFDGRVLLPASRPPFRPHGRESGHSARSARA